MENYKEAAINNLLEKKELRKAVMLFSVKQRLMEKERGAKAKLAKHLGISPSLLSHWMSEENGQAPSPEMLRFAAEYFSCSIETLVDQTVSDEKAKKYLKGIADFVEDYQRAHIKGNFRTHDNSEAHIKNLRTFCGSTYRFYYIHRKVNAASCEESLEWFETDVINEPEKSGYIELEMIQKPKEVRYVGNLIVPPELTWAFVFLAMRTDELFRDRGVIIFRYPQINMSQGKIYKCGPGIMVSVDRNDKNNILLQRIMALRSEYYDENDDFENMVLKSLKSPICSENCYLIAVPDIEKIHSEMFNYLLEQEIEGT